MVHPENTTTTAGFSFGKYELDLQKRCLTLKGVSLDLRPKSFDVLALLVRNAGTSVEREAIFKAVWPGLIVSGDSLAHCIGDIREALADDEKQLILTIPGRGYQFAANARLKEASPDRSISHRTSRYWLATALVASVLVLIIGIVASSLGNDDESRTLLPSNGLSEDALAENGRGAETIRSQLFLVMYWGGSSSSSILIVLFFLVLFLGVTTLSDLPSVPLAF